MTSLWLFRGSNRGRDGSNWLNQVFEAMLKLLGDMNVPPEGRYCQSVPFRHQWLERRLF
jgi:hypothetical protein